MQFYLFIVFILFLSVNLGPAKEGESLGGSRQEEGWGSVAGREIRAGGGVIFLEKPLLHMLREI